MRGVVGRPDRMSEAQSRAMRCRRKCMSRRKSTFVAAIRCLLHPRPGPTAEAGTRARVARANEFTDVIVLKLHRVLA
ncbi:hypothetical protein ACRS8P_03840 [Burkholderia cenocepacia]